MSERTDRINELARKQKTVGLTPEEEAEQKKLREEFRAAFRANFQKQLDNTYIETPDGEKRKLKKKNKIMRKRPHSGRFLFCAPELRFCTHKQIFRPQYTSFSSPRFCIKKSGEKNPSSQSVGVRAFAKCSWQSIPSALCKKCAKPLDMRRI